MMIIGLTGPTGAGKSLASKTAGEMGFKVVDCDLLARKAVLKGSGGLTALVKAFGEDILLPSGELDRKGLAKKAFATAEKTELLNKTLLPFIAELVKGECNSQKVLLDAPTLFESGLDSICSKTVAVLSDRETRLSRIMKRDGLSRAEALLRINAGKPDQYYIDKAHKVIYNNGDIDGFIKEFGEII